MLNSESSLYILDMIHDQIQGHNFFFPFHDLFLLFSSVFQKADVLNTDQLQKFLKRFYVFI